MNLKQFSCTIPYMDKLLRFLEHERVGILNVMIDGKTPHGAALHFSHNSSPFQIFFSTSDTSEKAKAILNGKVSPASVVIGVSEQNWTTVQLRGSARLPKEDEVEQLKQTHYAKHPNSKKFENEPDTIYIIFEPEWWRYSDLMNNDIVSSS